MSDFKTINFVREEFKSFYLKKFVDNIVDISTREFGIGDFKKKISKRHLFFNNLEEFNNFLRQNMPFFVSYSVGYFKYPERRPMDNKEWYGADIVYEFDSDDFDLPCHDRHNVWKCQGPECGEWGYGNPSFCEKCSSQVKITEWTCDECLDKAKKETLRLIKFLETDFKLNPSTFIISFSGSKGYHVRITDKSIIPLSKSSRLQLMNFILGNNLDLDKLGFVLLRKKWSCPSPDKAKGWSKKIMNYMIHTLSEENEQKLSSLLNISLNKAKKIKQNKEAILNKMYHNILWNDFTKSEVFWKDFINKAIDEVGLKIDPQASSDVYKIMRVPDTIHGGTGFLSTYIPSVEELKEFDSFDDPVVLRSKETKKIKLTEATPKFRILQNYYGPFKPGDLVDLPKEVAIFLLLKGVGKLE